MLSVVVKVVELFEAFGEVTACTLRIRREAGKVSWALVGFSSAEAARRAVAGYGGLRGRYTGSAALVVRLVDKKQAATSTGMMGNVMRTTVLRAQGAWPGTARPGSPSNGWGTGGSTDKDAALQDEAQKLFVQVDRDASGWLERDEVRLLVASLGRLLGEGELDEAMAEMDANGDELVDFGEFFKWWLAYHRKGRFEAWREKKGKAGGGKARRPG